MQTRFAIALLALVTLGTGWAAGPTDAQRREALWKSPPPPKKANAEFNAQDPYGLTFGERITVDCSIYWISTEDGKLYCFNSLTSKSYFMDSPDRYVRGARAFLAGNKEQDKSGAKSR